MYVATRALVLLFFLFNTTVFARGLNFERLRLTAGDATLHGVRYLNTSGQPNAGKWIIFTHGLGSNFHEFEYLLIPLFMAAGYDCFAFNFRGHGNAGERSLVQNYTDGAYRLEKMAEEDFPAMVREVQRLRGGQKGIIVGHSMGGMNPRAAFALGRVDQSQIESMVLLAARRISNRRKRMDRRSTSSASCKCSRATCTAGVATATSRSRWWTLRLSL